MRYYYKLRLLIRDAISIVFYILLICRRFITNSKEKGLRILVYHSIKNVPKINDPLRMTVSEELFKKQINYLINSGYKILSLDSIIEYISGKKNITGKEIAITFDDGFEDNLNTASNVLKKKGLTSAFFLTANYIDSDKIFPWCKKNDNFSKPLTSDMVIKLLSLHMTIGSHTSTHANLGLINPDSDKLYNEIIGSKMKLEEKLGIKIKYFAYPYGNSSSFNKITENIIKNSGYLAAFTNIFGENKKGDNLFELKRTRITWNDTSFKFRIKLAGAFDWVDKVKSSRKPI